MNLSDLELKNIYIAMSNQGKLALASQLTKQTTNCIIFETKILDHK